MNSKNGFSFHFEKGKALIAEGRVSEGHKELNKALDLEPENEYVVFEIGKGHFLNSDFDRAASFYKRAIELNKGFIIPRMELGKIYMMQRKLSKARYQLNKVVEISPSPDDKVEALSELGKIYRLYTPKEDYSKLNDIFSEFSKHFEAMESNIKYSMEMAKVCRRIGKIDQAVEIFKGLLQKKEVLGDRFLNNIILNELEITEKKEVLESKVRSMVAMILDRCNLQCRMCDIWKSKWQASSKTMSEIVDLFPYMEDINWEGGEVFLMEGFDDILKEGGKHKNLKQVIYTNGLMINEKILDNIQNIRADIVFSIDGATEKVYEHIRRGGSFKKLRKALSLVREFRKTCGKDNIKIYLNPVIMKSNYVEIVKLIEFAKEYEFDAVTFNPVRGNFGDENIFDNRDEEALEYIRSTIPESEERANKYGIRLNNWLPVNSVDNEAGNCIGSGSQEGVEKHMICYAPWQRMVMDNEGAVRPHVFCLNKWVGDVNKMSLNQIWNCEEMRRYRRKMAQGNYFDICQPECISGQVRENTREVD